MLEYYIYNLLHYDGKITSYQPVELGHDQMPSLQLVVSNLQNRKGQKIERINY